jgi:hypothetical protein
MDIGELQAEVAERYERLGLPSWPDPHPHLTPPREEEYSRVTDGGRYRIGHARMRIWADVLTELLDGVGTEPLRGADLADGGRPWSFDSGVRITASRPDTLPVVLLERTVSADGDDGGLSVAQIASVWPGPALASEPGCGCDACDDGSAYYLEQIDDAIAGLVGGPTVILQGGRSWLG